MGTKCLVLGANGFIGSHLVDALVARGNKVRAFDRFSKRGPVFHEHPNVEIFAGDFLNRHELEQALKGVDYVFHFIWTTTPATAENDPLIDVDTNIRMSVELLQLCVDAKVKRIIFASTGGAIYGQGNEELRSESDLPQPISPYAIAKLTIEHYLRYFKLQCGLDSVSLRISNPYGERQPLNRKQGVIPIFLEHICTNQKLTIYGDGSMVRDYLYVKDLSQMIAATFKQRASYDVYNVGSGKGYTVNELVKAVERISGKSAQVAHRPAPATFVNRVILDTSRFTNEFQIAPTTSLDDGLKATFEYIKSEVEKQHE